MTASTTAQSLEIQDLIVRFGGLTAVDGLTMGAPGGHITGLIGPNGAGKSTTFNACTGLVRPAEGEIRFDGRELNGASSSARARLGLGRTFQRMELWGSMTVLENVAAGREAILSARRPWGQLIGGRGERAAVIAAAESALERCGITDLSRMLANDLSTGQRRLVELARAIATGFRFLLLDEPSSGLDVSETHAFGEILEGLVEDEGIGILLVEHDMALVRRICEYIYVLDFGRLIHHGAAAEALSAEIVQAAYLGTEGVAA